jgi:hypothetical protein
MSSWLNKLHVGLLLGLLVPVVALIIYNRVFFGHLSPGQFLQTMISVKKVSAIISLGVLPNLLVFFIFIWLNYLYSARGVLAATLVYAFLVVMTKFLI